MFEKEEVAGRQGMDGTRLVGKTQHYDCFISQPSVIRRKGGSEWREVREKGECNREKGMRKDLREKRGTVTFNKAAIINKGRERDRGAM